MLVSFPNMGPNWVSVNYGLRLVQRNIPFKLPKKKSKGDIR
ncbi:MAG: hypothetical protein ACFFC1_07805 [Promethearchaeota archaeon]